MTFATILAVIALMSFSEPREETFRSAMQSDLRSLALAQELYHQVHFEYGRVADLSPFRTTIGVTLTVTHADGTGFAATAEHAGAPGVTCGYFRGAVPPGAADPATEAGRPVCD